MTSANTALREAILIAGLTPAKLAERVQVDPKTVERWLCHGRRPHPVTRHAVAAALGKTPGDLWPTDCVTMRPLRFSFAGICLWCEQKDCVSPECVLRHESSHWQLCPICEGTPWTQDGGCRCVFGLVEAAPKFARGTV